MGARREPLARAIWVASEGWPELIVILLIGAAIAAVIAVSDREDAVPLAWGIFIALGLVGGALGVVRKKVFGNRIVLGASELRLGRRRIPYGDIERITYTPIDLTQEGGSFDHKLEIRTARGTHRLVAPRTVIEDIDTAFGHVEKANPKAVVGPDMFAKRPSDRDIEIG